MEPYVVAPKPLGVRYLLWADVKGQIFMLNEGYHLFKIDEDRSRQLKIPTDTVLDGVVVRKRTRDGAVQGKLTFVIIDATNVDGLYVREKTFQERIDRVRVII